MYQSVSNLLWISAPSPYLSQSKQYIIFSSNEYLCFLAPIDPSSSKNAKSEVLIGDLFPGLEYKFDIHTISFNLESDVTHLAARTLPLIQSEVLVVTDKQERDIVTLTYTPTPQTISKFDRYKFSLGDPDLQDKEKAANDTNRKVTFTGKLKWNQDPSFCFNTKFFLAFRSDSWSSL